MRTWKGVLGTVLLLAVLVLAGCVHSVQEHQAGRMRALQGDLNRALDEWRTVLARGWFKTSAAATQDLMSRYEEVYARWAMQPDPLSRGLLMYALALAARVDRGTLSADEANGLLEAMQGDIEAEKARLTGPDVDEAMLKWWATYWGEHQKRYGASAAFPVRCQVTPGAEGRARIGCL